MVEVWKIEQTDTEQITSPLKAIRAKCLDCCCENTFEVKMCGIEQCPLHSFRFGRNPFHKRAYTDEQKEAMRERLAAFRASKTEEEDE